MRLSRNYAFGDSHAARQAFGLRTVDADLAFLVPHLRQGLRLIDFGCGGGGLSVQLARRLAPGEVVGFDLNSGAIAAATKLAQSNSVGNIRFVVGSAYDVSLPEAHFDIALFCGVLGHLAQPERALVHAYRLLKPGGIFAARELQKHGDWFGGPHWETIRAINEMHVEHIKAGGGDPFIGQRMKSLLGTEGFIDIKASPSFSPALSSVDVLGALYLRRLQEPEFVSGVIASGHHSADEMRAMIRQVERWSQNVTSIAGISECVVVARKPQ